MAGKSELPAAAVSDAALDAAVKGWTLDGGIGLRDALRGAIERAMLTQAPPAAAVPEGVEWISRHASLPTKADADANGDVLWTRSGAVMPCRWDKVPIDGTVWAKAKQAPPAAADSRMADALRWVVRYADTPERAARGPHRGMAAIKHVAERALELAPPAAAVPVRTLAEYHEDFGPVTWWRFPVDGPAWIGTPNDDDWPGYHTHWTSHPEVPAMPTAQGVTTWLPEVPAMPTAQGAKS